MAAKPSKRSRSRRQNPTPKKEPVWVRGFVAALRDSGNVRLACEAAKVNRATAYDRRTSHPEFAAAWDGAMEEAADALEQEARRRAHDGVRRVKFWQGLPIMVPVPGPDGKPLLDDKGLPVTVPYVEHEYSDTLLIFLLKGARPEKYRENMKVEHSGEPVRKEIVIEVVDATGPPAADGA